MKIWEDAPITEIFGFRVYTFGIYCLIGVMCSVAAIFVLCRAMKVKKGTASLLTVMSIVFGVICSRLVFCLVTLVVSRGFPFRAWYSITSGGWSLFGMICGVLLAAKISSAISKEKSNMLLDIVCCALPLTIAAERFAERLFEGFNVSRVLPENAFPRGTFLSVTYSLSTESAYMATYLLDALSAVILFMALVFLLSRQEREEGDIWILFLMLCGGGGVLMESLRYDTYLEFSFVRIQQVMAAIMLIAGVVLSGIRNKGAHRGFFRAAIVSLPLSIAICGGIEFALDRTEINHYLLYAVMFIALALPVSFGIKLLRNRKKGYETP